jgi:mRNA interferase RelE/StbE
LDWKIEYTEAADRQLRKLEKSSSRRILDYLHNRVASLEDPRGLGKTLHGPLGDLWSYRVGDYRIICELRDEQLCILVVRLGHRKDVHR